MEVEGFGARLREARERVGLSQEGAAHALGLNRVVLAYYENGTRQPSLKALSSIARLYGVTVAGLLAETQPEPTDLAALLFRSSSTALDDVSTAGIQAFSRLIDAFVDVLRLVGRPIPGYSKSQYPPARPRATRRDAARLARDVRDGLGLGEGPIGDHLFSLLDENLALFRLALGKNLETAPSGVFWNHPTVGFSVLVNSDMTLGRQVFTLAHELCHAFFHSQDADVVVSFPHQRTGRERFADWFAGELLVPADGLARAVDELGAWGHLSDPVLAVHIQRHFGVSYATLLMRLRQEQILTNEQYAELRQISPSRLADALGYEVDPADMGNYRLPPLERLPARMLHAARLAVLQGKMTRGDAAETLGVSSEDILRMLDRPLASEGEVEALIDMESLAGYA